MCNFRRIQITRVPFLIVLLLFIVVRVDAQEGHADRRNIIMPRGELSSLPFSDAVLVGNTLYISGRGGIDYETMKPPEDPREEAKLLMEDFKSVLAKADMTMDNLVSVTVYCPDLSLYGTFNEVYRSYFSGGLPARAFVGSGPLLFGMRFEMMGVATK